MRRKTPMLMGLAMMSLTVALWSGLIRLGWKLPAISVPIIAGHGPLMVSGFLGTLISLERAVALDRKWTYAGPICSGIGAFLVIAGLSGEGAILFLLASVILVADYCFIHRYQPTDFTRVMGLGALFWGVGNTFLLLNQPVWLAVPWWSGFFLFTIAGERLEMSRLRGIVSFGKRVAFLASVSIFVAGTALSTVFYDAGVRLAGVGIVALAIWLYQRDIARFTVRQPGLVRFIAIGMLSGYGWLALAGLLSVVTGGSHYGFLYDARLHALFLGYVMAMIMAHAPIILPAVAGVQIKYSPAYYVHLGLLQVSLVLRITADLLGWQAGRLWGGLLNEVAVILFVVVIALSVRRRAVRAEERAM